MPDDPQKDTATYQLIDNDNKIVVNGNATLSITSLTNSTLHMHIKEQYNENEYFEEWTTFIKR